MSRRVRSLAKQRARFDDRAEEPERKHKKAPSIRSFFDARPARLSLSPPRGIVPLARVFSFATSSLRALAPAPFLGSVSCPCGVCLRASAPFPQPPSRRAIARSAALTSRLTLVSARFSAFPRALPHVKNASFAKILALGGGVKYNLFRRTVPSGTGRI